MDIKPLGVFGQSWGQREVLVAEVLAGIAGYLDSADSSRLAGYMRQSAMLEPVMEHTRDILGSAFERPGGSAVMSDGNYWWRLDAADYVEHHAVAVDKRFIELARARDWAPPQPTDPELSAWRDAVRRAAAERQAAQARRPD